MVGKLSGATATSQSPDGSTPSTLCRGSGGAAVFLVLSGRKASVYPKDKKFSWMAKHEDRYAFRCLKQLQSVLII